MPIDTTDQHDKHLQENVHPSDWDNTPKRNTYDYIAIGGGTAGLVATGGAAMLGASTLLIERELLGGDCLVSGCVPSKAILKAAKVAQSVKNAAQFGITAGEVKIDFARIMQKLRQTRSTISSDDSAQTVTDRGVDILYGNAQFKSQNSIELNGEEIFFKRAIICTGARAALPPVSGLLEAKPLTNETLFQLTELPQRLAIIGGGPIGSEMCQAFTRLGSQVTLFELMPNIIATEDPEASAIIQAKLESEGATVLTNTKVKSVKSSKNGYTIESSRNGKTTSIEVDKILVATGRTPNLENLNLEAANVAYTKTGITVDAYQRTSNKRIYAAGDISSPMKFTHAAYAHAEYATLNALAPFRLFNAKKRIIPYAIYTSPEVAHIGIPHKQLAAEPESWDCYKSDLSENDRSKVEKTTTGFVKLYAKKGTETLIAATIVGESAGELIGQISLAMTAKATLKSLGLTVHPYPTRSESIRRAADEYMFTKLTPFAKKLARLWFKLMR